MIPLLIAGATALMVSLVGTRYLIDWLTAHNVGQPIHEDVEGHVTKAGTPTMGGVAFVAAAVAGYLAAHVRSGLVFTRTGLIVMGTIVGAGAVGALDDWIKVSRERNLGLSSRAKMLGLLVVAVGVAVAVLTLTDLQTTISFTRFDSPGFDLANPVWAVWAVLLIAGDRRWQVEQGLVGGVVSGSVSPDRYVVDKASRRTRDDFLCTACGHAMAADTNAALTIRARAAVRPAIPAPMSHLPSGGCARLTRPPTLHTASLPATYQQASRA